MYIRHVIESYLQNADGLHDKKGNPVVVKEIQTSFLGLRDGLLHRRQGNDPVGILLDPGV